MSELKDREKMVKEVVDSEDLGFNDIYSKVKGDMAKVTLKKALDRLKELGFIYTEPKKPRQGQKIIYKSTEQTKALNEYIQWADEYAKFVNILKLRAKYFYSVSRDEDGLTMIHYAVSLFYEYPSEMFMECMLRLRHLPSTLVKEAVYSTYEKYLWLLQVFREYIYSDPKLEALTEKRTQELLDEINKVKSESMKEKKLGEEDEAFINWLREAEHLEEKDIEIYKLSRLVHSTTKNKEF